MQIDSRRTRCRFDTKASGNWYKADEPWGAYLQTDGNPAKTVSPYESDPSSGSFNPQAHTTWVPTDWNSWSNCECPFPLPSVCSGGVLYAMS